jgi:hypothetical protein
VCVKDQEYAMNLCNYRHCDLNGSSTIAVRVTVTHNRTGTEERKGFCCLTHAALWLAEQAAKRYGEPTSQLREAALIE